MQATTIKHIETDRILLREWEATDFSRFAKMNADPLIMEYFPRVLDEVRSKHLFKHFQEHFAKHGYGLYALENKDNHEFMGFVGLNNIEFKAPFTPAVEIAWRLDYDYWGKGYATEAARAVLKHAFEDLKLEEVVAYCVYDNDRAVKVMEKLGMKRDKKADFDYPKLPKGHPLGQHILFRLKKRDYQKHSRG